MKIKALMIELSEAIKGPVDLRFSGGKFSVMVPYGNAMATVANTVTASPVESLEIALRQWRERTPNKPFQFAFEAATP